MTAPPKAMEMIVIKKDNEGETAPMLHDRAELYLVQVLRSRGLSQRKANLTQALNDVFNNGGKATGPYTFNNNPVWHASAGREGSSCTLFYYKTTDGDAKLFAMGEHVAGPRGVTKYRITIYGQKDDPNFALNKVISI
ncbi:hypothetical protein ACQPZ2_30435 [Nocardia pseudovaccinii]|uniref:hypothetical protein n=1 Tax=Nocardia pseudovaccinii TaxID=189540 RepID=UPI003D9089BA